MEVKKIDLIINPNFVIYEDGVIEEKETLRRPKTRNTKKGVKVSIPLGKKIEIWFVHDLVYSSFNSGEESTIHHKDGDPTNNHLSNLTTEKPIKVKVKKQNLRRGACGLLGVRPLPSGKFGCFIESQYLGSFDTPEEAGQWYDQNIKKGFGPNAVLNFPTNE